MEQNTLPPDILWKIINGLVWIVIVICGGGVSVFVFFHKQLLRRLDQIDNDLKPIVLKIALHGQHIDDMLKRLDEHGRRISELEKKK